MSNTADRGPSRTTEQNMEDKRKGSTSSSPLKCCQFNDSLTSLSTDDRNIICETKNIYMNPLQENCNNNNFHTIQESMRNQHVFLKKQAIDLEFENITFSSSSWSITKLRKETKKILHGVSGQFKSGEFSVIMGPSGAGKSTLLDVLAGFNGATLQLHNLKVDASTEKKAAGELEKICRKRTHGSTGTVKLNDVVRTQSPRFRKLSAYIPQDEELRMALTAKEAMTFAAHLKLGYSVSNEYKMQQVAEILKLLGLDRCQFTLTSRLSGGQRKRLAIALELLSNPPILFLDEPTTGLDSSSCTQCVYLFKKLAQEGRTIIATIHQPSALHFEMFDKLYALAEGKCIYDGNTSNLVNYFGNQGFQCPTYHNPADYLMEIAMEEHGADINSMAKICQTSNSIEYSNNIEKEHYSSDLFEKKKKGLHLTGPNVVPAAVIMQFLLLYKRNLLITTRCWSAPLSRLVAHVVIGFLFGYLYRDVGGAAETILANYVYIYGTLLLTVYTGEMPVTLTFPLEMKILTREHFNRWYKLTPYLLSVILIEIPFQVICTWFYIAISYWLTDQPLDFRIFLFVLFVTACSLCAQSMGYFIGATTPVKVAVFVAPVLACFLSVFGFCIRSVDTPLAFKWIFTLSYYRAAFQSLIFSVYGLNRQKLECSDLSDYCNYEDPMKFLKEMDILDIDLVSNFSLIVLISCVMHAATYLTLWIKLNKR